MAGNANKAHQPLLASFDGCFQGATRAGRLFPFAVLHHRMQLQQIQVIGFEPFQGALDGNTGFCVLALPGFGR